MANLNQSEVNKIEFWKERIKKATKNEHYSVYICNEFTWREIAKYHQQTIQKIVQGKALDAGCGYGRASEWVANYIGVDFSPDFIEKAQLKYPNKKFVQADLKQLPFQDQEFDWAFCISIKNMIENYESKEAWQEIERELRRVAKKVLILEYTNPETYTIL